MLASSGLIYRPLPFTHDFPVSRESQQVVSTCIHTCLDRDVTTPATTNISDLVASTSIPASGHADEIGYAPTTIALTFNRSDLSEPMYGGLSHVPASCTSSVTSTARDTSVP